MSKQVLENLKKKNKDLEKTLNQPAQERVKKINKYLSRYLYSLLGISITGSLLALAVFFTPWLPSIATALTAAFTVISALALPLLITIPIIAVALVLAPIAGFLWKKHQANSELSNSFEKLKKSLENLQKEIYEFDDEFDDKDEYEAEKNEIKIRQALCIHEFLATEKVAVNYDKIDKLLENCGISAEWIYAVDLGLLGLDDRTIPVNQDALNREINSRMGDECDSPNSTTNPVAGVDKFLLSKSLDFDTVDSISKLFYTPKKAEDLNQHNVDDLEQTIRYGGMFHNRPTVENSPETPQPNLTASLNN